MASMNKVPSVVHFCPDISFSSVTVDEHRSEMQKFITKLDRQIRTQSPVPEPCTPEPYMPPAIRMTHVPLRPLQRMDILPKY